MSLFVTRVDVASTGGVFYEIRDEDGLLVLAEAIAGMYGDDATVSSTELEDHEVDALEVLRRSDDPAERALYRLALVEISSRGS